MNKIPTNIEPKTHFGREYSHGRRKNVAKRIIPEQNREAIWVRPPTSPFIRDLSQKQRHLKSNQIYTRTEAVPSDRAISWQGTRDERAH